MLGLMPLRDFVHGLETVFKEAEDWPQPIVDTLFEGAAALRRAVDATGGEDQKKAYARLESLAARLSALELSPAMPVESGAPRVHSSPAVAEPQTPAAPPTIESPALPADGNAEPETAGVGATEFLRIPFPKLDALLNQVAELVQALAATDELLAARKPSLLAAGVHAELEEQLDGLGRVTEALRGTAMDLRLVPVQRVFRRFPSLARDLAHDRGKRVEVILEGETTELDKSTVDNLSEPLLHLVRNALDHGIEEPDRREAAGKPPEGTLWLRAEQRGDEVQIEVEDDGAGLDLLPHPTAGGRARPGPAR